MGEDPKPWAGSRCLAHKRAADEPGQEVDIQPAPCQLLSVDQEEQGVTMPGPRRVARWAALSEVTC